MTDTIYKNHTSSQIRYSGLDGLRGFAIILIILYHNFNFGHIFEITWISLDLFFALSGFLITDILLRKRTSENFLGNFYMRRVLRIFPIYYISLTVFLYILPRIINYPFSLQYFLQNQLWFWFYMQNWFFILKYQGNNFFLDHYWSLALEEQFYLVWPWLILLVKIPQKLITLLLCICAGLLIARITTWVAQFDNLSYENLYKFTRIDSLCAGSILAAFRFKKHLIINAVDKLLISFLATSVLVVLPAMKIIFNWRLPYLACCIYPFIAVFWVSVVRFCLDDKTLLFKVFNNRFLKFFGKISYGLYIFHWPFYRLFSLKPEALFGLHLHSNLAERLVVSVVSTALAIVLAVISYYCIEIHFLKLKRFF